MKAITSFRIARGNVLAQPVAVQLSTVANGPTVLGAARAISMALAMLLLGLRAWAVPLGTAFWYNGFLNYNGSPATGNYDFQAAIYDGPGQNASLKASVTVPNVSALNGLVQFQIDFGPSVFDGTAYWLDLQVQPSGNQNNWTQLTPRQLVLASPYSLFAPTAGSANNVAMDGVTSISIQNGSVTASKIASGQVVTSVNNLHDAVSLQAGNGISLSANNNTLTIAATGGNGAGWLVTGNAGTVSGVNFLGTTDNQPLDLRANNHRGLELQYASFFDGVNTESTMNSVGGYEGNQVSSSAIGGTIGGGGYFSNDPQYGGSFPNLVLGNFGTVGGGFENVADYEGFIGGGYNNRVDIGGAISGGHSNSASFFGFVGGGATNSIQLGHSYYGTIAGGSHNSVRGPYDSAHGEYSTVTHAAIGGGFYNYASGDYSTIPGGYNNEADGRYSFAAGYNALAQHDGCFVWGDSTGGAGSSGPNQFVVGASGGVHLYAYDGGTHLYSHNDLYFQTPELRQKLYLMGPGNPHGIGVQTEGCTYFRTDGTINKAWFAWYAGGTHVDAGVDPGPGGFDLMDISYQDNAKTDPVTGKPLPGGWLSVWGNLYCDSTCTALWFNSLSDRDRKQGFEAVDSRDVLERVLRLPISGWRFKEHPDIRHIGPMAQDFYAAFNLGTDDKHIGLPDEGGVALAAIQGLNQKIEEQKAQLNARDTQIEQLQRRLSQLEAAVCALKP